MILSNLKIYKTTLSYNYENVFDIEDFTSSGNFEQDKIAYKRSYKNYIDSIFTEAISLDINLKSINRVDDRITITVPYSYDEIHDYNYVCLWNNVELPSSEESNSYYFYFIENIQERNSVANENVCTITLVKDIWAENYVYYKYGYYDKIQNVEIKTIQRYERDGNNFKFLDDFPLCDEIEPDETSKILATFTEKPDEIFRYAVLWEKIALDEDVYIANYIRQDVGIAFDFEKPTSVNFNVDYSYLPYIFYPVAVFDINSMEDITSKCKGIFADFVDSTEQTITWNFMTIQPSDFSAHMQQHILFGNYTFNPPFETGFLGYNDDGTFSLGVSGRASRIYISPTDSADDMTEIFARHGIFYCKEININSIDNNHFNYTETEIPHSDYYEILTSDSQELEDIEPCFSMYPWKYYSVFWQNNTVDIISSSYKNEWRLLTKGKGEATELQLIVNNENTALLDEGNNNINYLFSNGNIPFYKDTYYTYMRNESEKMITEYNIKQLQNVLQMVTGAGIMTSGLAGMASAGTSTAFKIAGRGVAALGSRQINQAGLNRAFEKQRFKAKIQDLKNAQGEYTIPQQTSNSDLVIQDRPFIYINEGNNTLNKKELKVKLKKYGENINTYHDITLMERRTFDFIKTSDCSIISIPNLDERTAFESILNNGVRIWHLDDYDNLGANASQYEYNSWKNFNPMINNPDKTEV